MTAPRQRILFAAMLAGAVGGWDAAGIYFVYPAVTDSLAGGDQTQASWVLSITSIVSAALLVQVGRIADRYGYRRVYAAGALLFAAAGLAAAVAPGLWWLVGARAFAAAGLAVMGPSAVALILRLTEPQHHAAAIGRWGRFTAIAALVGPIIAATLIQFVNWRLAFALQIPLGVVVWWLARHPVGVDHPNPSTTIRPFDVVLSMAALITLVLPILKGNVWGWTSPRVVGLLVASALLFALLVLRSRDPNTAPLPLDILGRRNFVVALCLSVTAGATFFAQWLAYLLFITEVWGWNLLQGALVLTLMPGSMIPLAVPAGRLADRRGPRAVIIPAAVVYVVATGAFWLAAGSDPNFALLIPALVAAGVAMAGIWPTITSAGNQGVEPERLGTSSAVIQTMQRVGAVLGIAIVVALVAGDGDVLERYLRGVAFMPVSATLTLLIALFLPKTGTLSPAGRSFGTGSPGQRSPDVSRRR